MIQVISTAPHASVVKEVICRNCGATLQYTPADVQQETHKDYAGGSDTYYFIKCPPCGHKVTTKR